MYEKIFFTSLLVTCGIVISANAQTFTNGSTYLIIDYTGENSTQKSCNLNKTMPNDGGLAATGGDLTNASSPTVIGGLQNEFGPLVLVAESSLSTADPAPAWFFLTTFVGSGPSVQCKELNNLSAGAAGVDISANYKVAFTIKSSVAADLDVFIGSVAANGFYPGLVLIILVQPLIIQF